MKQADDFARWLTNNPPPDLQAISEYYGGLGLVPENIWKQYQADMVAWQSRRANRRLDLADTVRKPTIILAEDIDDAVHSAERTRA
jgi:hypothetical protein